MLSREEELPRYAYPVDVRDAKCGSQCERKQQLLVSLARQPVEIKVYPNASANDGMVGGINSQSVLHMVQHRTASMRHILLHNEYATPT